MRRVTPALALSALLSSQGFGQIVVGNTTTDLNGNKTIASIDLYNDGNLTLNNTSGNNTITKMQMYFLKTGAGATFNVTGGTLNLNLSITNQTHTPHTVAFNVSAGGTLNLTSGTNGGTNGIFRGISTTLSANVGGTLNGSLINDAGTNITIQQNGKIQGNITQNSGTLEFANNGGTLDGNITISKNVTQTNLWSYKDTPQTGIVTTITGNITQEGGQLNGILRGLNLKGSYTQNGGNSDIAFHTSTFENNITLTNSTSLIHFYDSNLKSISTNGGNNTINLKGRQNGNNNATGTKMQSFSGSGGANTISLIEGSTIENVSQSSGSLNLSLKNSSANGSVTSSNDATLMVTLADSKITGSINTTATNATPTTTITATGTNTIGGNINQSVGTLSATLSGTTISGAFTQTGGKLDLFSASGSKIEQGIVLSSLTPSGTAPQLVLNNTTVQRGIQISNLIAPLTGQITGSTIDGGFDQTNRKEVFFTLNGSTLNGGIKVRSGGKIQGDIANKESYATAMDFQNGSKLSGGVTSNAHSLWLNFDNSQADGGDFMISDNEFYLKGSNQSNITANITAQNVTEMDISFENTTLTGNITQNTGKQVIVALNTSKINGDIINSDTQTTFEIRSNSELNGAYTQTNGSLNWVLGGSAIIHKDVTLNTVDTTLSNGNAIDQLETIKGNLTQNGGSMTGVLGGLTLNGIFTQNAGENTTTFNKANFTQEIKINDSTLTQILFDQASNLKTTTFTNSTNLNNTFTLDHTTTLDGDFVLKNSKVTLEVKNASKITGSILSDDKDSHINIDFSGDNNQIGGNIEISNGTGDINLEGTTITGDLILTDARTHFHITNSSLRNIFITRGTTMMTLDSTQVRGEFKMSGKGDTQPTLKLRIGNASSIAGNLTFEDTEAFLGGFGENNSIGGNLLLSNSTVTNGGANYAGGNGDPDTISSMAIAGNITQTGGITDLSFTNTSSVAGNISITNAEKSHLSFADTSSIHTINVENSKDTIISISNQSTQDGGITFNSSQATISAYNQSAITSSITSTNTLNSPSDTHILLDNSTLTGDITQDNGKLLIDFLNHSTYQGKTTLKGLESFKANLESSSSTGELNITTTPSEFNLTNQSSVNGKMILNSNSSFVFNASNSSYTGDINHTGSIQDAYNTIFNFTQNSTMTSSEIILLGAMQINLSDSQINVDNVIRIDDGKFGLTLNHATGTIQSIQTGGQNQIQVSSSNSSDNTINVISLSDQASLSLTGNTSAHLKSAISLQKSAKANIVSANNAFLELEITPSSLANLDISLNGGILQGQIIQTQNPSYVGYVALNTNANFGGRWIVTGDSQVNWIDINNSSANVGDFAKMQADSYASTISLIDLTKNSDRTSRIGLELIDAGVTPLNNQTNARTLRTNSLTGFNGVFRVYTDIQAEKSDKISAAQAKGNHIVQVYYNPATFSEDIEGKYIVVAHVDDQKTTANFTGGYTDVGNQSYKTNLLQVEAREGVGYDWILGTTENSGPARSTKLISSIMQSQYRTYTLQTQSLRQRVGELREIERTHGLWAQYSMGINSTQESDVDLEVKDYYYSAYLGYDQNVLDLRGQNFYGFALSYNFNNPQCEEYVGEIHSFGFNFYDTFIAKNDFYVDVIFKYVLSSGSYAINYYSLDQNAPSYLNHKVILGAEIGKKFKLSPNKSYFFLEPDLQIAAGYISGNDLSFIDSSQTTIQASLSGTWPVILRTGLSAGYSLNKNNLKSDFYLGSSFFYETTTGGTVNLDDGNSKLEYSHKGAFKMSIQGGFDLIFDNNSRMYFEAGTSFLGKTNTTYYINVGARFSFGYKNTRELKVPSMITPPPPPPPQEYDPRNIPVITDYTTEDIRLNGMPRPQGYSGEDYFINTRKFYRDETSLK